ncbi:putative porin [Cricetibacter osteomyelitidis]|uniref:Putative porin n=1 Tax=Cricetibacter osteomyelitidis TaxID=1521931 RepID=A0A4R2T3U5_9PAST|nr:porin [Cricetibacter osteomyelitidis]TCP95946.1 putative porin [Cricetibacter osteomyelitidis]
MKKTLVALAVAAMAATSSANALITVYEQEGTKVELGGSVRMFLGRVGDDQRGDLKNDGSRLIFRASHDLGNGFSAFGGYQLRFEAESAKTAQQGSKSGWGDPTTRELYLGFKHQDVGALSFGRQLTNADDFLQDSAYYNSAALSPLTTRSDKSVKFRSAEWNGFSFGLDYLFGDADKSYNKVTSGDYKNGFGAVAFYNLDIDDMQSFNAALLYTEDRREGHGSDTGSKKSDWGAHLGYVYGPFDIAVSYVRSAEEFGNSLAAYSVVRDKKHNYILLDAGYRVVPESRLYVQWERLDTKYDSLAYTTEIINQYTAGIDYKLHKNVVPYIEYAHQRTKDALIGETEKDNVFGVGLRVHF